ncbi:ATP-binding region ATPase domain protein [Ammonifex degensii KC4]|uniref:ATP-binding region ATPase domain protein n=1 Tax=Ammonifex degensii (strain DSM 10501 / KC4) TaxID=429009 RepID=C9R843_AMMDK|nr:ATP-binding protein [Ammonifex degensii]ACX52472.1 ATP-binding region ATPase domain protein [Ammonifex degensii KC4]
MATVLDRIVAEMPRASEYFTAKELQAQTGQPAERFACVVLKELVDNALDAAEAAGVAPEVSIDVAREDGIYWVTVADNGPGIASETIKRIIDFSVRVSDKSVYRSPTRGAQGNALKTVIGIPFALGCDSPVVIESRGVKHQVRAWTGPLGDVKVEHREEPGEIEDGARVTVPVPADGQEFDPLWWARAFAAFNLHASVKIRVLEEKSWPDLACSINLFEEAEFLPTVSFPGGWRKFLPTDLTSPHWYTGEALLRLVFAYVNAGKDLTLRDFVRQFRGLTASAKAKAVRDRLPEVKHLSDFEAHPELVSVLLAAMKEHSRPAGAEVLGWCGEEHFKIRFEQFYGLKRYWYKRIIGDVAGIPYVVEAALGETDKPGSLFIGVNFSPTFEDPLASTHLPGPEFGAYGIGGFLSRVRCHPVPSWEWERQSHVAAAFHLISPALDFLDRTKTRLKVPDEVAQAAGKALWAVCKTVYREEKRRERDAARAERAAREREKLLRRQEWTLKDAVFEVLPEALERASGGGKYPVSARTLYYQVRPLIQTYTGKELDYNYFSQQLLLEYQERFGPIEALYYDPRGYLYEPHTGRAVALGTREVESYDFPAWVFDKILYVEKKGLWPVLQAARLAERYDMAVVAAEGYATQAARVLFRRAERNREYRLFVLHDADPYGYNIARTLREETRRMKGYRVDVVDIGLKLEEALEMGLESEEFTRHQDIPQAVKDGLTDLEREWFIGRQVGKKTWICRRIELNAMSAPQLVSFIEAKLAEHGATAKVLPPEGVLLAEAGGLFWSLAGELAKKRILELLDVPALVRRVLAQLEAPAFEGLFGQLKRALETNPPESWRELLEMAVLEAARESLDRVDLESLLGHARDPSPPYGVRDGSS